MRLLPLVAMLGFALPALAQEQSVTTPPASAARREAMSGLPTNLAAMRNYRAMRVSSEDRPGNADMLHIAAGQTTTIAELEGPGEITHLWTTIAAPDPMHLRNIVIRIYWDGMEQPSVEAPIGDFYGLGHAKYYYFSNPVQAIGTNNGMNCFWPMPFAKSAKVTISNEADQPVHAFYYYVDWRKFDAMPENVGYFHAQYRQAFPNESGKPYLILNTTGAAGHFVGVSLSILTQVAGWWGEGDDIFTIDGEERPSLWGTGSEDYFCGAWCYGKTFYTDYFGMPLREQENQNANNYWNVYRHHLESPIPFKQSLKVEIEHGAAGFDETRAGGRNNDYASVAYFYLAKPQAVEGPLPAAAQRIPEFRNPDLPKGIHEPQYMNMAPLPGGMIVEHQGMEPWSVNGHQWLNGDQLFARGKAGDVVSFEFETTAAVSGPAVLRLTKAPDYGKIRVELNDRTVVQNFDGYSPQVTTATVSLGDLNLPPGKHNLTITMLGKSDSSRNFYWGIDYLRIGGTAPEIEGAAVAAAPDRAGGRQPRLDTDRQGRARDRRPAGQRRAAERRAPRRQ
jgi:hypothetical protein